MARNRIIILAFRSLHCTSMHEDKKLTGIDKKGAEFHIHHIDSAVSLLNN